MKFIFVRHGQTDWNRDRIIIGWNDPELNEEGIKQSYELLASLENNFDVIYSSPFKRAYATAEIISKHFNLPIVVKDDLKERNFGSLAGKTWAEMDKEQKKDMRAIDRQQKYDYTSFGGESAEQVKERVLRFVDEAKKSSGQKPLVVCHGGVIRMLHYLFSNKEIPSITNISIHEFNL